MRRAEMRWHEVRIAQVIRDEMKCGLWSASVKREVQGVKSAVWSVKKCVRLALRCNVVARRSCSWTAAQQVRTMHTRTGLAGAQRMQVL